MINKSVLCLFAICLLMACKGNADHQTTGAPSADSSAAVSLNSVAPVTSCYVYSQNGDTIRLKITTAGNTFSGHLLYQLKEKDRNNGTLQGTVYGDTLIADYRFASEGITSTRQVAFLKQQNKLQEGFGELTSKKNDQWVFNNRNSIKFTGFLLTPVACN